MKALLVRQFGGAENLVLGEVEKPYQAPEELLVRVKAAGVNRADILQREGHYPPPGASPILGLEIAGVVESVGESCRNFKKGDEVFGLLAGGGYAEYAVIHHQLAMLKPPELSFEEAAAIPEAFLTAFQALFWIGKLQKGENVLIHAGGSGVGTAAIQLAREAGATVFTTAGSQEKLDACRKLGAQGAFNYKIGAFAPKILHETENHGVQLILDFVGVPYWEQNIDVLDIDGRLVILGLMGGFTLPRLDLRILMKKRLTIAGSTLRNRSLKYKIQLTKDFAEFSLPRFSKGRLKAIVSRIFPWESVQEAHRFMEENRNIGKIVLKISD